MPAKKMNEKEVARAKQTQLVRSSLELLTMVASARTVTKEKLYQWCVRSERELDRQLRWAAEQNLVARRRNGRIGDGDELHLTHEGTGAVMLNWISRHGGASRDQMATRFKLERLAAHHILNGLHKKRRVTLVGAMKSEALLYVATRNGLDAVARNDLAVMAVASREEGHVRACADQAIVLEAEYGPEGQHGLGWELWGEREHAAANKGKRGAERFASPRYDIGGRKLCRRPDQLLIKRSRDGEIVEVKAIEVELSNKSRDVLDAIFWAYCLGADIDQVIYYISGVVEHSVLRARLELESRVQREIAAGNLSEEHAGKITVIRLPEAQVPSHRRAAFYEPQPIPGAAELLSNAMVSSERPAKLRLELLHVVEWVTLNGVVTADAVDRWLGPEQSRPGSELLRLAHGAGWLHHSDILRDEGSMFFATREGRNAVGLDLAILEVDCSEKNHYFLSATLCRDARVAAELAREFPHLIVKSRWEMRCDALFNGSRILEVGIPGEGLGNFRAPEMLLIDPAAPAAAPIAVVVMPAPVQGSRVKTIAKRWSDSSAVSMTYLYIADAEVRRVAREVIEEIDPIEVRMLPRVPNEWEALEDVESLAGCSLASESRTAWVNT